MSRPPNAGSRPPDRQIGSKARSQSQRESGPSRDRRAHHRSHEASALRDVSVRRRFRRLVRGDDDAGRRDPAVNESKRAPRSVLEQTTARAQDNGAAATDRGVLGRSIEPAIVARRCGFRRNATSRRVPASSRWPPATCRRAPPGASDSPRSRSGGPATTACARPWPLLAGWVD